MESACSACATAKLSVETMANPHIEVRCEDSVGNLIILSLVDIGNKPKAQSLGQMSHIVYLQSSTYHYFDKQIQVV